MTARHKLDGSLRPVNIFSRPHRLHYLHKYTIFFLSTSPPDISNSRVDFSNDGSSRTRRVLTARHHFQKVPRTFFKIATSCYFTSANTTTRLPLHGSSSPKSRPDSVRVYWTTLVYLSWFFLFLMGFSWVIFLSKRVQMDLHQICTSVFLIISELRMDTL